MALLPAIRAHEVLGHAFSCHIRGAGPGGPCAGMPGSRLAGVTRRPGSRQDTPAKLAGTAFGCGSRPRRRAHPSRGGLWASLRGCPVPGQRWASFPGDGRLLLLQCTASLPGGSGQWNSCNAPPHCLGAVGSATPALHRLTALGQWAVTLLQCTTSLPGGSWQWNSCNALPHCLGAVGSGTPAMHRLTALGAVGSATPAMHCLTGVVWCGVVWCGVVWCGVVWCGVVWCGVVWCGVVWCGVPKVLLLEGNGRDVYQRVQVNGWAVCLSARCVLVCCCTAGTSAQSHLAGVVAQPTRVHGHTGSMGPTAPCVRHHQYFVCGGALLGAVPCTELCVPCRTALAVVGSGQWNFCNALPHCPLLGGSGQRNSCYALPH